jgi:hypothetical protein
LPARIGSAGRGYGCFLIWKLGKSLSEMMDTAFEDGAAGDSAGASGPTTPIARVMRALKASRKLGLRDGSSCDTYVLL